MSQILSSSALVVEHAPTRPTRAIRLLWLACVWLVVTMGVGRAWDAAWHTRNVFDSFWSPPHLFVYIMAMLNGLLIAGMALTPGVRRWFGTGVRVPLVPFEVPGALFILGGGFVSLGFAGIVLDNLWHTNFGLDETGWSTPHAMIGWSLLVIMLGFVACRLALRREYPLRFYTVLLLGLLLLGFSMPVLGPFARNNTPETISAIARIPALAAQRSAQDVFRISLAWNLDRTNPALIVLGAAWAGIALALLHGLDRRARVFLMVALIWTMLATLGERSRAIRLDQFLVVSNLPASWLPLPLLPSACALALAIWLGWNERWAWASAGLVFGLLVYMVWGRQPWAFTLVPLAAPAMLAGAWLGKRTFNILEHPSVLAVKALVLMGVVVPLLTGMLDLYMRAHTP
jgi:hypothetical protein